jgi:hypothetical protein
VDKFGLSLVLTGQSVKAVNMFAESLDLYARADERRDLALEKDGWAETMTELDAIVVTSNSFISS